MYRLQTFTCVMALVLSLFYKDSYAGPVPPCEESITCQNGGNCRPAGQSGPTCVCPPGWGGDVCEIAVVCHGHTRKLWCPPGYYIHILLAYYGSASECNNGLGNQQNNNCSSTDVADDIIEVCDGHHSCSFTNNHPIPNNNHPCQHLRVTYTCVNVCQPNPCQNGGTCTTGDGIHYCCKCTSSYTGTNCTDPVCAANCASGGCTSPGICDIQCLPGYYKTLSNTCSACRPCCSWNQVETTLCNGVTDRVCSACDTNCASGCTSPDTCAMYCQSGYYLNGNTCTLCTLPCNLNQVETTKCNGVMNRVCSACDSNCASGCTTVNTCATQCSYGYYLTAENTCTLCTVCTANEAETQPCDGVNNRQCAACASNCASGCTSANTCATRCQSGYYLNGNTCTPCTTCNQNQAETRPCDDGVYNRQCAGCDQNCISGCTCANTCATQCRSGYYLTGNTCAPCTTCAQNEVQTRDCDGVNDRQCAGCDMNCISNCASANTCSSQCRSGYYLNGNTCLPCTTCAQNEVQTRDCDGVNDRQCAGDCSVLNGGCSFDATCSIVDGKIQCTCLDKFYGDGYNCTCKTEGSGKSCEHNVWGSGTSG